MRCKLYIFTTGCSQVAPTGGNDARGEMSEVLISLLLSTSCSVPRYSKNRKPSFLPIQLVHFTTQRYNLREIVHTSIVPPSGCNVTVFCREYNLHLINIPSIAGYEKVYTHLDYTNKKCYNLIGQLEVSKSRSKPC